MKLSTLMICFLFVLLTLLQSQSWAYTPIQGEQGPLSWSRTIPILVEPSPKAFRVESWGDLVGNLTLRTSSYSGIPVKISVRGPLDFAGDFTSIHQGSLVSQEEILLRDDSPVNYSFTLPKKGVYRIILESQIRPQSLFVEASCLKACNAPDVSVKDLLLGYKKEGKLDQFWKPVERQIEQFVTSPELRLILIQDLHRIAASSDLEGLEHFPTLPTRFIPSLQTLMATKRGAQVSKPDPVLRGRLEDLLGPCHSQRDHPAPVPDFPSELRYGHFPDLSLTACQNTHSQKMADIFTSLAADNGSVVEYKGKSFTTVTDLIKELLAQGHQIHMGQERTYANFLAFVVQKPDGTSFNVRWPTWLETGYRVEGDTLNIPSGHSQHVWEISGPTVQANLTFFLGVTRAGFYARIDKRPAWTATKTTLHFESSKEKDAVTILNAFQAASFYLKLNRKERSTIAAGMMSDGYGYLGICNDSDAVVEVFSLGRCSAYPIIRNQKLNLNLDAQDPLTAILRSLPDDTHPTETTRLDTYRRILEMNPDPLNGSEWFDEKLRNQILAIKKMIHPKK